MNSITSLPDDETRAISAVTIRHPRPEGPFDIHDFDDPTHAEPARLDLGALLVPMPRNAQIQVELTDITTPATIWFITPQGRFSIAAYAAPKTAGLWREIALELVETLRDGAAEVSILDGPWGREILAQLTNPVRFIGVDGPRWMIRCVISADQANMAALTRQARHTLADTVVRRGNTPLPVRTPLPMQLPDSMAQQLRLAAAQHQNNTHQPHHMFHADAGSAMQQLRG